MYSSKVGRFVVNQSFLLGRVRSARVPPYNARVLVRCCSAAVNKFNVKQLAPSPDAFIQRHIGPSEEEQKEMLKLMELEVNLIMS